MNEQVLSSSDDEAMMVGQALFATSSENWIVDSGVTCHMCNNESSFSELHPLSRPQEVTLGDGHVLEATAEGTVTVEMLWPDGCTKRCKLQDVLYVPYLSHNFLSVSKASEAGKSTKFDKSGCEIMSSNNQVIAFVNRVGNLLLLGILQKNRLNTAQEKNNKKIMALTIWAYCMVRRALRLW